MYKCVYLAEKIVSIKRHRRVISKEIMVRRAQSRNPGCCARVKVYTEHYTN